MSLDQFFFRHYDAKKYNCLHFAAEVWMALTGDDILTRLEGVMNGVKRSHVAAFRALKQPASPCLVLMRKAREDVPHIGVFYQRRTFHITRRGAEFQPLEVVTAGFSDVRFYR